MRTYLTLARPTAFLVALCAVCAGCCQDEEPLDPAILDVLQDRLGETRASVAEYLGINENEIVEFWPNQVSPMDPETARSVGLDESYVSLVKPTRLPPGTYPWRGPITFAIRESPRRQRMADCFYDAETEAWLVDRVVIGVPVTTASGGTGILWEPVDPVPGWDATAGAGIGR